MRYAGFGRLAAFVSCSFAAGLGVDDAGVASAQVIPLGGTSVTGPGALADAGAASDTLEIALPGGGYQFYSFTAGTIVNSATDSILRIVRSPFSCGGMSAVDKTLDWPGSGSSDGIRKVKAMKVFPSASIPQNPGAPKIFVAGRVPGTAGHWDLALLALDEKLDILWTQRFAKADDLDAPVLLATSTGPVPPSLVAIGYTQAAPGSGKDFNIRVLAAADGTEYYKGYYSSAGNYGDTLNGLVVSEQVLLATGTTDKYGWTKIVTASWDMFNVPAAPFPVSTIVENTTDGLNYGAMAMSATMDTNGPPFVSVTGWRQQPGDVPTRNDYYTVSYGFGSSAVLSFQWSDIYDGPSGENDEPMAIITSAVNQDGVAVQLTWVTGRSQRGPLLDHDALTRLYAWDSGGTEPLVVRWTSRWDGGLGAGGREDVGIGITLDPGIQTIPGQFPYVYLVGRTQVLDVPSGQLRENYVYLSYDPLQFGPSESKPTRFAPLSVLDPLPPACFYGVGNGNSFAAPSIKVHQFEPCVPPDPNCPNGGLCRFMIRTGQSWNGATGYDMVTTLERDDFP